MFDYFFQLIEQTNTFFWGYIGFSLISLLGLYLTFKTGCFQIRALPSVFFTFYKCMKAQPCNKEGIHPLKAFFASVGGMIGIGNVVGISAAIQLGGPGALLWVWVAGIIGTLIKYSEIYLGLKFREKNPNGGYNGGPMYFLQKAYKGKWVPILVCVLLCIYGVEAYQFTVVTQAISTNWNLNEYAVIGGFLMLILYTAIGGVPRVSKVCSWIMPSFICIYLLMAFWVLGHHLADLPAILGTVFKSAFTGHAAIGGFAGSTMILAIQNGVAGAAYSSDLGIGYDSIIQSESKVVNPARQARLAILGVCLDNLICTMSILIILISGIWQTENLPGSSLVQVSLENYFPLMNFFMPLFIFILGYTTIIAYFCVGIKCARYLHPKHGVKVYFVYAVFVLVFFSFFDQTKALEVMRLAGASLLIINLIGIFILRKEISFEKDEEEELIQNEVFA